MASGVVQGHVEFVMKSGVVSIVATCQRVEYGSGPCRGLPESDGAAWNPLQSVE